MIPILQTYMKKKKSALDPYKHGHYSILVSTQAHIIFAKLHANQGITWF